MGVTRFIGCLHFGHKFISKLRGFDSSEEHDALLIETWNKVVNKRDKVFILGDITMETDEYYPYLDELKGSKHVVLGNHDLAKHIPQLYDYVDYISGMVKYKGYWVTHCPIHPQELSFVKGNIHAHIHNMTIPYTEVDVSYWDKQTTIKSESGEKYYNVDAGVLGFKPITLKELIK